ncbi:hypothetical protein PoB_002851400 [Plakobranchus ocellatus]|uniref:Uncharacterized protein n=1 Tax=Plakobranchus ocellatus TaxID=259542 RepID=A0AAV4A6Z7_9GAST|nr:hypothetical protein PoB_002851400 [Plakobranchus ocellatus]
MKPQITQALCEPAAREFQVGFARLQQIQQAKHSLVRTTRPSGAIQLELESWVSTPTGHLRSALGLEPGSYGGKKRSVPGLAGPGTPVRWIMWSGIIDSHAS